MLVVVSSARYSRYMRIHRSQRCALVVTAWCILILIVMDHRRDLRAKEKSRPRMVPAQSQKKKLRKPHNYKYAALLIETLTNVC